MRLLNRIILIVVLAALAVFGIFSAVYAFAGSWYERVGLPSFLAFPENADSIRSWMNNFEIGSIPVLSYVLVIVVFVIGLALLILEIMPHRRSHLKMSERTWINAKVVEKEAEQVALQDYAVLESDAKLRSRRGFPSKLKLSLAVRSGEDTEEAEERVQSLISSELVGKGQIAIGKVRTKSKVKDPRQAKTRVK